VLLPLNFSENVKTTLVIGLGVSGQAATQLLARQGKRTFCIDRDPTKHSPGHFDWDRVEQVIVSPGVPLTHPVVQEADRRGIEVIGEIELGSRAIHNHAIGVTGTNGKTTTVLLLEHIFNQIGYKAVAVGNIGRSLCSYALNPRAEEWLIVELSSFQLETMHNRWLDGALFLNLTPDHLERYAGLEEYGRAKCRIEQCLKKGAKLWISQQVEKLTKCWLRNPVRFDLESGVQNILAVTALCRDLGFEEAALQRAIQTFQKPAHRMERVEEWHGISFYNDSKATNIDSVRYAVEQFSGPLILLAGGIDKGASYRPWIEQFQGKVRMIFAFGQAAQKMKGELENSIFVQCVEGLREALCTAMRNARQGDTILLSPGCSSFDQFQNYEHRGNEFKRMIKEKIWIEKKSS
jgi:UDP-N-acetylmuramoylalanine--D-glutamate ligase